MLYVVCCCMLYVVVVSRSKWFVSGRDVIVLYCLKVILFERMYIAETTEESLH